MGVFKKIITSTAFLDLINFVISFLICRWFYMNYIYFYAIGIIGFSNNGIDFWRPLIAILILTIILFTLFRTIYTKNLSLKIIILLYILYFSVMFFMLFLKSPGIQGYNINIMSYLYEIFTVDSLVPLFNILMFIPLGILFKFDYKNIALFILFIFLCEIIQYVLKVGIFDIGDILLNTVGFLVGSILHDTKLFNYIVKFIH